MIKHVTFHDTAGLLYTLPVGTFALCENPKAWDMRYKLLILTRGDASAVPLDKNTFEFLQSELDDEN